MFPFLLFLTLLFSGELQKKKNAVEGLLFQHIGEQMGTILQWTLWTPDRLQEAFRLMFPHTQIIVIVIFLKKKKKIPLLRVPCVRVCDFSTKSGTTSVVAVLQRAMLEWVT